MRIVICHLSFVICCLLYQIRLNTYIKCGDTERGIFIHGGEKIFSKGAALDSHLAPVHKYLIRSIKAINSNTETVKSYHCCQMSCCLLPPFTSQFSTWCKI
ncbi:MAG: hypothetical protein F6K31_25210 [Symploca sp. SIO2G7]|nr:hypothetical protein [Symploca sp. SIO2G7]